MGEADYPPAQWLKWPRLSSRPGARLLDAAKLDVGALQLLGAAVMGLRGSAGALLLAGASVASNTFRVLSTLAFPK